MVKNTIPPGVLLPRIHAGIEINFQTKIIHYADSVDGTLYNVGG